LSWWGGQVTRLAHLLFFLDFIKGLAVNTLGGCGSGFQSFDANVDTTGFTITVIVAINEVDGGIDFFD
jgi:hypothetical protein